ncbi:hypothetical protein LTR17_012119 [Elasticomyces elasticus]|nr:hypothetical protein LTR17_012119 [Elasticomyces elasticus]
MRLLNVHTFCLEEYHDELHVPPYVVASHRWQAGTEAMIEDIELRRNTETKGYKKVEGFAKYIREHIVGVDWLWIDTCCVTQHSTKEVDEAVRAMFRWYANAHVCLAYLSDVVEPHDKCQFEASQWHRRGWTLQELLAPQAVIFLSRTWDVIGHKLDKRCTNLPTLDVGPSLVPAIAEVARIPGSVLYSYEQSRKLTVEEKLTWTVGRDTTKGEDMYYSLLGIFGVDMRLSYGEGRVEAKARLLRKIAKSALPSESFTSSAQPTQQPWLTHRRANPQYTGYAHVLDYLERCILLPDERQLDRRQVVVVLLGMGGVGKSEAVLHFVETNRKELRERLWAVLWVDCSSDTAARADFKRISDRFGWEVVDAEIIDGVRDLLGSSSTPSLLILDNCDNESVDYNRYIPGGSQVSVVLTTRLADAGKYASRDLQSINSKHLLRLEGLDVSSAIALLLDVSLTQQRDGQAVKEATRIVTAVGFHPLAITVAGSLIQNRIHSLQGYAGALQTQTGLAQNNLLNRNNEQAKYTNISATFEVSAQALAASSELSAKNALALLDILPYIHHQGISEDMFIRAWSYEEDVLSWYDEQGEFRCEIDELGEWRLADASAAVEPEEIAKKKPWRRALKKLWKKDSKKRPQARPPNPDLDIKHLSQWHVAKCREFLCSDTLEQRRLAFRDARAHLTRLSLITTVPDTNDSDKEVISVHLLIAAWAKQRNMRWFEAWSSAACVLALSMEGYLEWPSFSAEIEPHLVASFSSFGSLNEELVVDRSHRRQLCRIWYIYAWQLERVESPLAVDCCVRLLHQTQALSVNVADDEQVIEAQYLLGVAYRGIGRVGDALKLLEHIVRVRESQPKDHVDRLASQHELAIAYLDNGEAAKAVELLEHVVRIRESLPEDHPERLASQHELARAYRRNGQVALAVQYLEHIVWIQGESLVEDHPQRLRSQRALADAYIHNEQEAKGVRLLEHVVQLRKKLAEDSHDRLASQHALATAYLKDGQVTQAIELLEHVVRLIRRSLPEDHPHRLVSQYHLACAYLADGQVTRAAELLEHVVAVRTRCLAEDHPERLASQNELARAYWSSDRHEDALYLVQHVVRVRHIALRADHPNRLISEELLANILADMVRLQAGRSAEASTQDQHKSERERNDEESEEDAVAGAEADN